jgi:hypothetical protein
MEEITNGAGTRYDERVVASCLAVIRAGFRFAPTITNAAHAHPGAAQS